MAAVTITPVKLAERNEFYTATAAVAIHATDGAKFKMNDKDEKYLIIIENSAASAKDVTIKKGNSIQGVVDITYSVPASGKVYLSIDSGMFKNVSGTEKGNVLITGGGVEIKVAVAILP